MKSKYHLPIYILLSGFLFVIDQLLKYFARINPQVTNYLWKPWLGWEFFGNTGIAFSLPVPNWLVVVATPLLLCGLVYWLTGLLGKKGGNCYLPLGLSSGRRLSAICLILFGALSNYIDRILFGFTIDYLRVLTGVINLADVMIVLGVWLMLVERIKSKE